MTGYLKASIIYVLVLIVLTACDSFKNDVVAIKGFTMGTTYSIKLYGNGITVQKSGFLKEDIDSVLVEVNRQMSNYKKDSEITNFNNFQDTGWVKISEDFATVINMSQTISKQSGGAFDITIAPLIDLWGFGIKERKDIVPSVDDINKAKESSGYQNLMVNTGISSIKKSVPNLHVSLSAIAKGYGVDEVARFLETKGYENFMVEIGGEIRTKGVNLSGIPWQIGISTPDGGSNIEKVLQLEDLSVATSGDYRNYFESEGKRYSHSIDPRTGYPIAHKLASVTVVHESCAMADGYATAITVLGPEEGMVFALENNLDVFMIVKSNLGFKEVFSPGFEVYLSKEE